MNWLRKLFTAKTAPPSPVEIASFFNEASRDEEHFPSTIDERILHVRAVLDWCGDLTGKTVADVGCGKGRFARIVKERNPGALVVGIDIAEAMLRSVPSTVSAVAGSLTGIPLASGSCDAAYATESLEHAVEIDSAVAELCRILKPGGRMFITAPLGSGLHQEPYHFYGGYTPHWYRHFCNLFSLDIVEISPNGGFFKHLAQECARVAWTMPQHQPFHAADAEAVGALFGEILPRYLFAMEESLLIDKFTVGFHVEVVKRAHL